MHLLTRLRNRKAQLNKWEIQRILDGVHAVSSRSMRQIRAGIDKDRGVIVNTPRWWLNQFGVIDRIWEARFWVEQNIQLMR
jgi:hypothetical protein